jgi:hypothetical protein
MSAKFKPGDMVEILHKDGGVYRDGVLPGKIGTIVNFYGYYESNKQGYIPSAWSVRLPDVGDCVVAEESLKLIPGNQDCEEIGSWDECPWSPYNVKDKNNAVS